MPEPEPATTGSADSTTDTDRSTSRVIEVASVAVLFAAFVSVSLSAVSVVALSITSVPAEAVASIVSTTVSVALAPEAKLPRVQVGSEKLPALGVTDTTETPEGSVSALLSSTPVASTRPLLVTVAV